MIKLLFDANLSYRLVKKLTDNFKDCIHVSKTGLSIPALDIEIWDWAKNNNYIIVTNDEDFENISQLHGFPPKVILIRTGNQSSDYIAGLLQDNMDTISDFIDNKDLGILEVY